VDARTLPRQLGRLARSRWFGLLIGALVLLAWAIFLRSQLTELQRYPWQINPWAAGVGVLLGAAYFGGLAGCWALLLRSVSREAGRVSLAAAAQVWLLSMMTRYIPGNVWHILSRVALAGRLRVARTHVLSSATIEQVLTLLGALALFGLTLPLWGVLPGPQGWLVLLLPVGLLLLHPRLLGWLLRRAAVRLKRPELAWNYRMREIIVLVLAYGAAFALAGLSLWALLWGLAPVALAQLPLVVGASALAWAVGYLSFLTPSGLGVREAALTALLALAYPLPVAIVGSLLFRVAATLGEGLAVLVAWLAGRWRATSQPDDAPGSEPLAEEPRL
jgi:hypothetical protein